MNGLNEAFINATMTAGAAISWQLYEMNTSDNGELEPQPLGKDEAVLASHVANVAARAAEVAMCLPGESIESADEVINFTMSIIRQTKNTSLLDSINDDYWNIVNEGGGEKPWWRFW